MPAAANGAFAGAGAAAATARSAVWARGSAKPSSSPPPAAALTLRNARRDAAVWTLLNNAVIGLFGQRRLLDGRADAHIRSAAADVSGHCGVDIGVVGMGHALQQSRGRHNLP